VEGADYYGVRYREREEGPFGREEEASRWGEEVGRSRQNSYMTLILLEASLADLNGKGREELNGRAEAHRERERVDHLPKKREEIGWGRRKQSAT